jgi:nucleoside 2-deoxyribosyltransferase
MKTIYISGPMSNIPNSNLEAFDEAEKQLKQLGFNVLNPHKICEELNIRFFEMGKIPEYEDYLKEDIIQMLSKCDTVLVLPGWRGSKGSKLEIANAIACGLDVVFDISDVH